MAANIQRLRKMVLQEREDKAAAELELARKLADADKSTVHFDGKEPVKGLMDWLDK